MHPSISLARLAELELELGRERRAAARDARRTRGQHIGRPMRLDKSKAALAQRMQAVSPPAPSPLRSGPAVPRSTAFWLHRRKPNEDDTVVHEVNAGATKRWRICFSTRLFPIGQ
jgi:hypothetical protein